MNGDLCARQVIHVDIPLDRMGFKNDVLANMDDVSLGPQSDVCDHIGK